MVIGYRVKQLRRTNGMSQQDLGNLLGVSKVSVSGYENGTRVPSMSILVKMVDIFKVSADYILGRELNVVCEGNENNNISLSSNDINIIKEIKAFPSIYNLAIVDPKRFFNNVYKNM